MRQIILYGELGKRFGREHHLSVRSASEAFQAMCVNFPGFRDFMRNTHKYGIGFKVFVGKSSLKREQDANLPSSDEETIRICPALFGSSAGTRILVGSILVVAGAVLTIFSAGTGAAIGGYAIKIGAVLILGGVAELLAGTPKKPGSSGVGDDSSSFIFSGPENVTRQGGGIPVGYGRMMVGSTVVSAGIEDEDR